MGLLGTLVLTLWTGLICRFSEPQFPQLEVEMDNTACLKGLCVCVGGGVQIVEMSLGEW